jgi:hypothetical protein
MLAAADGCVSSHLAVILRWPLQLKQLGYDASLVIDMVGSFIAT